MILRTVLTLGLALGLATVTADQAEAQTAPNVPYVLNPLTWPCEPQAIYIDQTSAPNLHAVSIVVEAVEAFQTATGRPWPLSGDPAAPIHIRWMTKVNGDKGGARNVLSAYPDSPTYLWSDIQIQRDTNLAWLPAVARHELGHLELDHTTWKGSLMGPNGGSDYGPTDVEGLRVGASLFCR